MFIIKCCSKSDSLKKLKIVALERKYCSFLTKDDNLYLLNFETMKCSFLSDLSCIFIVKSKSIAIAFSAQCPSLFTPYPISTIQDCPPIKCIQKAVFLKKRITAISEMLLFDTMKLELVNPNCLNP